MSDRAFGRALDELRPGRKVYVPGSTGESLALIHALQSDPERAREVLFMSCFVPGMNEFDYAALHPTARVATFMLPRAMHASLLDGRVDVIPRSYAGAADVLSRTRFDVGIFHVAPPDAHGRASLGIASDFAPLVWPNAARRIVIVNACMPAMPRGPRIDINQADVVIEVASELITAASTPTAPEAETIGRAVAALIPDDAHIQTGIGGAPGAVWAHLRSHRGLVLRSGMANDPLRDLAAAGALAGNGDHCVGVAYGSREFYEYLAATDLVRFSSTPETHGWSALAALPRLHTINSALEVDLFGQVNVEWQGGQLSSGVGGAADFARAALASPGGRAITALAATAKGGTVSRIVPRLMAPSTGLPRSDIDTVVTEYGTAELRDRAMDARAETLIAIAAPQFRDSLWQAWRAARRQF